MSAGYRVVTLLFALSLSASVRAADEVAGKLVVFNDNGGWCWFQDERAIVRDGYLLIGSVADASGSGGATRDGNIEVTVYDIARGAATVSIVAAGLRPADDHNSPALLAFPDGRILAVYSRHGLDPLMRWTFAQASDPTDWGPEDTADLGAGVTYSNVFRLAAENGRLYNFHRGRGYDPNIAISEDGGTSWTHFAQLLRNPEDPRGRIRPYLKYSSNGRDTIHFIASEAHPQQSASTSLYHGFLQGGSIHRSEGAVIKALKSGPAEPASLTQVFAGNADRKAWPNDLELDKSGKPVAVYSVHLTSNDHRYRYAVWDGTRWNDNQMAFAGTRLYKGEEHYTGLASIDPDRTNMVYISTDVDPANGDPLVSRGDGKRHYEIFKGVTQDGGMSWTWTPITSDSTVDNIRPIVPAWDGKNTALLWLRGTYKSYTDYDLDVVGLIEGAGPR